MSNEVTKSEMGMESFRSNDRIMAESSASKSVQEVQAMLVIAKNFPRDEKKALEKIENACSRPKLAESALYSYARGKTEITGASIRLAEAIAQVWGNLEWGIRELERTKKESVVEAFCWDTENNTRQSKTFAVPHTRHTKKGSYALEDPRDIYENVANQGARRLRACILGVIPGDVVETAVDTCMKTLKTNIDVTPARIKEMLTKFDKYGVKKADIEKFIQRRIDSITPALMARLGTIYTSLKDGMGVAEDYFDIEPEKQSEGKSTSKKGVDKLKTKLSDKDKPEDKQNKDKPEDDETIKPYRDDKPEDSLISQEQIKRLYSIATDKKIDDDKLKKGLEIFFGYKSTKDIPESKYDDICKWVEKGCPEDDNLL